MGCDANAAMCSQIGNHSVTHTDAFGNLHRERKNAEEKKQNRNNVGSEISNDILFIHIKHTKYTFIVSHKQFRGHDYENIDHKNVQYNNNGIHIHKEPQRTYVRLFDWLWQTHMARCVVYFVCERFCSVFYFHSTLSICFLIATYCGTITTTNTTTKKSAQSVVDANSVSIKVEHFSVITQSVGEACSVDIFNDHRYVIVGVLVVVLAHLDRLLYTVICVSESHNSIFGMVIRKMNTLSPLPPPRKNGYKKMTGKMSFPLYYVYSPMRHWIGWESDSW